MVCVRIETVCVQQILLFCFVFLSPSVSLTVVEVGGKMSMCVVPLVHQWVCACGRVS